MIRAIYSLVMSLAAPVAFAIVLLRGMRDRAYWEHPAERFGWVRRLPAPALWLHAVSMGEVAASVELVRALRARHPDCPFVLTTSTPTGRARARAIFGDDVDIRFLPYDTPGSVRRFLDRVRPRVAIILETELWPNLVRDCVRRDVPVVFASARLRAKSVAQWSCGAGVSRMGSLWCGRLACMGRQPAGGRCRMASRDGRTTKRPGKAHRGGQLIDKPGLPQQPRGQRGPSRASASTNRSARPSTPGRPSRSIARRRDGTICAAPCRPKWCQSHFRWDENRVQSPSSQTKPTRPPSRLDWVSSSSSSSGEAVATTCWAVSPKAISTKGAASTLTRNRSATSPTTLEKAAGSGRAAPLQDFLHADLQAVIAATVLQDGGRSASLLALAQSESSFCPAASWHRGVRRAAPWPRPDARACRWTSSVSRARSRQVLQLPMDAPSAASSSAVRAEQRWQTAAAADARLSRMPISLSRAAA